jgi:hypothetical protein
MVTEDDLQGHGRVALSIGRMAMFGQLAVERSNIIGG